MNKRNYALIPLAGFIGGISLQAYQPQALLLSVLITCALLGATAWTFCTTKQLSKLPRACLVLALAACAGYLVAGYHHEAWLQSQQALMRHSFDVEGFVRDVQPLSARPYMAAVQVSIEKLRQQGNNYSYRGALLVHYMPLKYAPAVGSKAVIAGITPPRKLPTGDMALYFRKQHIAHQLFSQRDAASIRYEPGSADTLAGRLEQRVACARTACHQQLTKGLEGPSKQYVGLMFCGHREAEADDIRTLFNRWGLGHFLARSGLHIVVFVLLVSLLLRAVPLHAGWKECLLLLVCYVYDLLTWSSTSFLRAWLMVILVMARSKLGRHTPYQHLLSMSCIGILCYNPCYLFSLDFQLTYALTMTLVLLNGATKQNPKVLPV